MPKMAATMIILFALVFLAGNIEGSKLRFKLISVHRCDDPSKMDPDHPVNQTTIAKKIDRDTFVIEADIFVKQFGPATFSYRTYQMQQNAQKNLVFKMEKVSCTNPLTFKVIKAININIDKNCIIATGHYRFENLELNRFSWLLSKATSLPGKYAYEIEFSSPKGIVACTLLVVDLIERK